MMTEPAAIVVRRRARAEARLLEAVGSAVSLCAVSRSGGQHPAAKYHEGAVVALRQVDGDGVVDSARRLLETWLEAARRESGRSDDWVAYRAGGVDELAALVDELAGPGAAP